MENKDIYCETSGALKAGATESTPSRSQYFSWINNTNEGSTEEHTLINLAYFAWLKREFGMELDIYAWDAGNLDGSCGTYETLDSPKLKTQFPKGYAPVAEAAAKLGTRLGVWCGPDGFGDTPESAAARRELMVSLCRDCNFGLFKMDAVCGGLREEMQDEFVRMMEECRKYSPDLILLNHRLRLGRGLPYATTFLFNGQETYTDVHIGNDHPAPHHRAYMFHRGNVPGLLRLTEDHGVCISSCVDFFEDELIYQAFGRSLILAPEIYANPWFMRDDAHAKMARIYNLHRTYRDILVNGMELPERYGPCAVSRGSEYVRFITTGNDTWERKTLKINLNREIGLERCDNIIVSLHHPYERFVGCYSYGDIAEVTIEPFRAALIEVSRASDAYPMLTGCSYEVLREKNGVPEKVKILASDGCIAKVMGEIMISSHMTECPAFDNTLGAPAEIPSAWERQDVPENAEEIFETAMFVMDNDSLEIREVRRSGETKIPEVKAARDAFFAQRTYAIRGCESRLAFDGDENTFFDGVSKVFYGSAMRLGKGCLRVDFGDVYDADEVLIEYFDIERDDCYEVRRQIPIAKGETSADLAVWHDTYLDEIKRVRREEHEMLIYQVHNIVKVNGSRKRLTYKVTSPIRYFRLPDAYDRIFKVALRKDGHELALRAPKILNLLPSFRDRELKGCRTATVKVPDSLRRDGSYLAIGIDGKHGREGVYAVAELDGKLIGCEDRAVSYPSNAWECPVTHKDRGYTYYLTVKPEMLGKELKLYLLEMTEEAAECSLSVHLCEPNDCREGIEIDF